MLPDCKDIASYIASAKHKSKKLIEVGMGKETSVYKELVQGYNLNVIAVDLNPSQEGLQDDALNPRLEIYGGAEIIYSIRPPPELIPGLQELSKKVGAKLIIRPLLTDSCCKPEGMQLINHGRAVLWVN